MVDPPQDQSEPLPPAAKATGFEAVAQTLKRRTTDLLALAILALGILAVGTKVSRWWKQSPDDVIGSQVAVPETMRIGDDGSAVTMEFGEQGQAFLRQVITGDAASAGEQLEQIAIAQIPKASLDEGVQSAGEAKLLAELANVPASKTLATGESLYRIGEELPMVIVTRPISNPKTQMLSEDQRVVCWARAFPRGEGEWLVVLFHPVDGKTNALTGEATIPLPQGSTRIQSLHDAEGQSWIAFRGTGPIAEWERHFTHEFHNQGWERRQPWSKTGSNSTAAFESSQTRQRAEIWLGQNATGHCEGMILIESVVRSDSRSKQKT